uniref:Uncharacterized protein n=1 Tax=Octopus bimaculoides TaxID=37653 RepID=A0A0L8I2N1_OCTBM|eukprot:XP_014767643.1 PREDICTED: acyl-CoA-binding domain-containing protein 6 homolog [Octopus bimaculoides]
MDVAYFIPDMEVDENIKQIMSDNIQFIVEFIQKYPQKVNQTNSTGKTYLMAACIHSSTDMINMLIEAGSNLNVTDKDGLTALH